MKNYPVWNITQTGFDPKQNLSKETLFSVGNGYMAARAYMEEPYEGDYNTTHRGTYMAGVFDGLPADHELFDMVNMPGYFECEVILNGEKMRVTPDNAAEFQRDLDMKKGTYTRSFIYTSAAGEKTKFTAIRFASLHDVHIAAQRIEIVPLNWNGTIELHPGVKGDTFNFKFIGKTAVTSPEKVFHLRALENAALEESGAALLHMETLTTKMRIAYASQFSFAGAPAARFISENLTQKFICKADAKENSPLVMEKIICVYTSRDCDNEKTAALNALPAAMKKGFAGLLNEHAAAWEKKWAQIDVQIDGPDLDQQAVRFNMFQLIQSNAENDPRVNIAPRGLFGERYRGGAFWDTEIYMSPFFELTNPPAAANLVKYRYYGLAGAKAKAEKYLFKGAMYPWVSCHGGTEQCPGEEFKFYEIHVTADVARGVTHYWDTTGDDDFIISYGAEILIETARFWVSRSSWSRRRQKYVIMHVIGPDEFCGRNGNNTFTNMMVLENFKGALKSIELLKKKNAWDSLKKNLNFDESTEMAKWRDIIEKMYINYCPEEKLYLQDDDFDDLPELDVMPYRAMGGAGQESIPHSCWEMHKVVKQADVILLMFLLSDKFTDEEKTAAWNYYEHRTLHSSSLSYAVYSIMAAELGKEEIAVDYYRRSARLDIDDTHNNTGHGLHTPAGGGSWQVILSGFGGLRVLEDRLLFKPKLPAIWNGLKFKIKYRGWDLAVNIRKEKMTVNVSGNGLSGAKLDINGKITELSAGAEISG